jgi:dihydrolipoamide dehydrogenase
MKNVKVAIIGAGSGGLSARREVLKKTEDYVVIDGGILGTTCARVGCMPSKVLIQVAEDFHRRSKLEEEGISGGNDLTIDSAKVMTHVRKLRDRFVRGVTGSMESWSTSNFIGEYAKFIDPHTLQVGDEIIKAEKIVIATGSTPNIPTMFKGLEEHLITTDSFFELEKLPKSIAVLGLGVIGIELGQALDRLGVDTVGIARREIISGVSDPKLREYVNRKFSENMKLSFDGVASVEKVGDKLKIISGDNEFLVEKILLTAGRTTNWDSLGTDCLNLTKSKRGIPEFDPETFQLKDFDHIFLAGDNTGEKQVLHEASDEGRIAGYNCVNEVTRFKLRTPLVVTFSDPNIAFVGKMYDELIESKIEFEIGEVSFEGQGRSIVKLKEIGMLRVYGCKKTGTLLGAELMAPDGEHLAHLLSWVISQNLTVNQVLAMPFYHPVIEEGLRTALRDLRDKVDEVQPVLEVFPI